MRSSHRCLGEKTEDKERDLFHRRTGCATSEGLESRSKNHHSDFVGSVGFLLGSILLDVLLVVLLVVLLDILLVVLFGFDALSFCWAWICSGSPR